MYENGKDGAAEEFPAAAQGAEMPLGGSSAAYEPVGTGAPAGGYSAPHNAPHSTSGSSYPPPAGSYAPPGQYPPPAALPVGTANEGLSDTAAGAIAYITIIPAILFLILAPYNQRPFVKFHSFQCLGLGVVWICLSFIGVIPILGWIVWLLGSLGMLVIWVMAIIKASQGSALKLPVISKFASEQSGYRI